jgi:sialidase-1
MMRTSGCVIAFFLILVCHGVPGQETGTDSSRGSVQLEPQLHNRCLAILREGLRSNEFWPAMHAAEALTLAGDGSEVRDFLLSKLAAEKDDQHRCGLARELVRAGDRSKTGVLLDILASDDAYGHTHAAESLFKVGEVGDGSSLRAARRRRESPKLRLMAAAALGRCGNPDAMALLREQVVHADAEVRRIAAWVLTQIGDASDLPALRAGFLQAEDPLTGCYFANALATLGDDDGRRALRENLAHEDPAVRIYAANFAGDARAVEAAEALVRLLDDAVLDVRIRAAQSLLTLSRPPGPDPREAIVRDVYPATERNPRYSEGSIVPLAGGELLFATTEFIGGGSDFSSARLVGKTSRDGGRTWSEARLLQEQTGKKNVMSVSLLRLGDPLRENASLGMFYLVKNSPSDLKVYVRLSRDEAQTFGEPIAVTAEPGYHVVNNDRVVRLSKGRLLAPVASTEDVFRVNHFVSRCWLSDDGGLTWRQGTGSVDLPQRGAMEPEVFEQPDGRVGMIVRTQLGHIVYARSADGGQTWSEPETWSVQAPEAPATVRRIPATGDLLLIWNNAYTPDAGHGGTRTPLTAAVSSDEGRSWKHIRNLESDSRQTYAYTSLAFVGGSAVMSYYVSDETTGRISSRFRSMPIAWFYEPGNGDR